MDIEKFTELLDEKIFGIAKELRDEHGLSNLIINQDSTYSTGQITVSLTEK
ncbi:hypothetical protein HUB98_05690 [Paenibacillus barcinonensis]|uniref:Uncharacterized protein n=1 Tax=Paenibacillus barcinonensis TaxID=198119 RepID=A0A2V4VD71_PAEBA|nr:hypothetical protein [Paenibacillus barcinonensis]PYE51488.1 hypothetical protein DFQ00_102282 [Paenibacillus barcinonensis]QKS55872.1 hypothetical protein HUB98_05690 [Paenibacillus barcinonensis]